MQTASMAPSTGERRKSSPRSPALSHQPSMRYTSMAQRAQGLPHSTSIASQIVRPPKTTMDPTVKVSGATASSGRGRRMSGSSPMRPSASDAITSRHATRTRCGTGGRGVLASSASADGRANGSVAMRDRARESSGASYLQPRAGYRPTRWRVARAGAMITVPSLPVEAGS
jgi:hypothetical protein